MYDFKPGDEVVCVDVTPQPGLLFTSPIIINQVYTVDAVGLSPVRNRLNGTPVLWLREVKNICLVYGNDIGFAFHRFRKVVRKSGKLSLTEWLRQPSGDTERLDKSKKRNRVDG